MRAPSRAALAPLPLMMAVLFVVLFPVLGASADNKDDDRSLGNECAAALEAWQAIGMSDIFRALVHNSTTQPEQVAAMTGAAGGVAGNSYPYALAKQLAIEASKMERLLERCTNATGGDEFSTSALEDDGGEQAAVGYVAPKYVRAYLCVRNMFDYPVNFRVDETRLPPEWNVPGSIGDQIGGRGAFDIPPKEWQCRYIGFPPVDADPHVYALVSQPGGMPELTPGPGKTLLELMMNIYSMERFMSIWAVTTPRDTPVPNSYFSKRLDTPFDGINRENGQMFFINEQGANEELSPGLVLHYKDKVLVYE